MNRRPKKHTSAARRSVSYSRNRFYRADLPPHIALGLDARFDGPHDNRLRAVWLSVNRWLPRIVIEYEMQLVAGKIPER